MNNNEYNASTKHAHKSKTEKIDLLIELNIELIGQVQTQQGQIQTQQGQIQALQNKINNLNTINSQILLNTDKMTKHIDFINGAYEKITKSYFFKSILG